MINTSEINVATFKVWYMLFELKQRFHLVNIKVTGSVKGYIDGKPTQHEGFVTVAEHPFKNCRSIDFSKANFNLDKNWTNEKFSAFLDEAARSFAAKLAEKLNLTHVGYGKYANAEGRVTHMSKDGKLVKLSADEIDRDNNQEEKKLQMARVRSIKVQYLLLLEDSIPYYWA